MKYNNPDVSESWYYGKHYKELMNIQIKVVEAIAWISQQDFASNDTNQVLLDTIDDFLRDATRLRDEVNQSYTR